MLFQKNVSTTSRNQYPDITGLVKAAITLLLVFGGFRDASATGTAEFECLPRGARADAMGGTGCAAVNDAFAAFYNPAAPAMVKTAQAALEYAPLWDLGDNLISAAAVLPLPQSRLAVSAGYSRFQSGGIPY